MRDQAILLSHSPAEPEQLLKGVQPECRVYKLVLTGGPCGGKTTGQSKVATFFENIGWKVFRVPETATLLMSGGIAFADLNEEQVMDFQENLVRTMIALEDTYFSLAAKSGHNCLVICDRGTLDAAAFISRTQWEHILDKLQLDERDICEERYDHVVHMVSAANGAEAFYSFDTNCARFEGLEMARERDRRAMEAWRMHPYVDIVDNRAEFDQKVKHLVDIIVKRTGLEIGDQFKSNSRKVKFLIDGPLPADDEFPAKFTDFEVVHHYLQTGSKGIQSRLRKRGHLGRFSYSCAVRRPERMGQVVEVKTPLSRKDYEHMLNYADERHLPVYKTRRCFLHRNQQYQLDIYRAPCHARCDGLLLLETFTTLAEDELQLALPDFLRQTARNVTGDPAFSMYNLALRADWSDKTTPFCHRLSSEDDEDAEDEAGRDEAVLKAEQRFLQRLDHNHNCGDGSSSRGSSCGAGSE